MASTQVEASPAEVEEVTEVAGEWAQGSDPVIEEKLAINEETEVEEEEEEEEKVEELDKKEQDNDEKVAESPITGDGDELGSVTFDDDQEEGTEEDEMI